MPPATPIAPVTSEMPTPDLPLRLPFDALDWRVAAAVEPSPRLRDAVAP
jgi:hypothetical protein